MLGRHLSRVCRFQACSTSFAFNHIHQKAANVNYQISQQKPDLNRAISEAERIVGYPTSFLSLRWLLSDEISSIVPHLNKLNNLNHPLLMLAKNLVFNGYKSNMQAWGLIVLLISKSTGLKIEPELTDWDLKSGLLHSQRALAEITEMIRTSQLIHKGIVNLQNTDEFGTKLSEDSELIFGNKIALLGGDYLLSMSGHQLAVLKNQYLIELMMSAVRDLSESNFIGDRDEQNNPLPFDPLSENRVDFNYSKSEYVVGIADIKDDQELDYCEKEWSYRNTLSSASLLGKSCHGALMLAGHSEELQQQGYLFGKHLALAWQAKLDSEDLQYETAQKSNCSLVSAPILFHLQYDPTLYVEIAKGKTNIENVDYGKVREIVLNGPGIERTQILQQKHLKSAMNAISSFPPSDARNALLNIANAIECY